MWSVVLNDNWKLRCMTSSLRTDSQAPPPDSFTVVKLKIGRVWAFLLSVSRLPLQMKVEMCFLCSNIAYWEKDLNLVSSTVIVEKAGVGAWLLVLLWQLYINVLSGCIDCLFGYSLNSQALKFIRVMLVIINSQSYCCVRCFYRHAAVH